MLCCDVLFLLKIVKHSKIMTLPIILAAAGLATQVGSSIVSNIHSAEANRWMGETSDAAFKQQNAEAEQLKASEGDFMNTALGKQMMESLRRQYNDARKRDVSGGLKHGQTEESKIASAANLGDTYAKSLANIAATGTQYRSHVLSRAQDLKNAARNRKYNTDMAMLDAENQSALNIADNGMKIGSGMLDVAGSFLKTTKPKGAAGAALPTETGAKNSGIFDYNGDVDLLKERNNYQGDNPFKNYNFA